MQKWLSDGQDQQISEVSQVVFGGELQLRNLRFCLSFFCLKMTPGKSWKSNFSGIPRRLGPTGPCLCDRSRKKLQTNGIETSVRPNGTPVMPILRSRSTVKKTVRKKHGLVVKKTPSGKKESPNWSYLYQILIQTGSGWNLPFIRTVSVSQ